jgi:hypothetical protein
MQEINLYQPVSKGVRGALSAGSTALTLGIIAVSLLGLWGFAWRQVDGLRAAAAVVRTQQAAQTAMSAVRGPQLDGLADEELAALVARLGSSVESKTRALAMLDGETDGAPAGFSRRLRAFAVRHIDGIWLERLTFGAKVASVSVSGSTLTPDSVPRYLRSLAEDPALKGGQIDDFVIEKPTDKKKAGTGRMSFRAGQRGLGAPESATGEDS